MNSFNSKIPGVTSTGWAEMLAAVHAGLPDVALQMGIAQSVSPSSQSDEPTGRVSHTVIAARLQNNNGHFGAAHVGAGDSSRHGTRRVLSDAMELGAGGNKGVDAPHRDNWRSVMVLDLFLTGPTKSLRKNWRRWVARPIETESGSIGVRTYTRLIKPFTGPIDGRHSMLGLKDDDYFVAAFRALDALYAELIVNPKMPAIYRGAILAAYFYPPQPLSAAVDLDPAHYETFLQAAETLLMDPDYQAMEIDRGSRAVKASDGTCYLKPWQLVLESYAQMCDEFKTETMRPVQFLLGMFEEMAGEHDQDTEDLDSASNFVSMGGVLAVLIGQLLSNEPTVVSAMLVRSEGEKHRLLLGLIWAAHAMRDPNADLSHEPDDETLLAFGAALVSGGLGGASEPGEA